MLVAGAAIALIIFSEQGVETQTDVAGIPLGIVCALVSLVFAGLNASLRVVLGEREELHSRVVGHLKETLNTDTANSTGACS